jgi:hypothetical protein
MARSKNKQKRKRHLRAMRHKRYQKGKKLARREEQS